jgi:Transglutaminase-like superfamily
MKASPGFGWRIRRAAAVGWRRRTALVQAIALLPAVSVQLRLQGYRATVDRFDRGRSDPRRPRGRGDGDSASVVGELAYVVRAAARIVPDATCLRRSIVLRHLLAQEGIASTVRLGVRPGPGGGLSFHAWVVVDETVVSEPERLVADYVVLDAGHPPPGVDL